jgi:hypothetical protein
MNLPWKKHPKPEPTQLMQRFAITVPIMRELYCDRPACDTTLEWIWEDQLDAEGGTKVEGPTLLATRFVITLDDGREVECAENEGWDLVWMRMVGFALPPADFGA